MAGTADDRRRAIAAFVLVGAPLAMLVADAMLLAGGENLFWPWSIALWVSFVFFIPAVLAIVHLVRAASDGFGLAGGALAIVGAMIGGTIQGVMRAQVVAIDVLGPSAQAPILASYGAPPLLPTSVAPGLTFPVGLTLLAVAVWRAGVLSAGTAAILAIGALLFPVGRIGALLPVSVASDALLLMALGTLALRVWRRELATGW